MSIDKLLELFDNLDDHGEAWGYYIPEIIINAFYVPKDRTFHHLFHTVMDFKNELITIGDRKYANEGIEG